MDHWISYEEAAKREFISRCCDRGRWVTMAGNLSHSLRRLRQRLWMSRQAYAPAALIWVLGEMQSMEGRGVRARLRMYWSFGDGRLQQNSDVSSPGAHVIRWFTDKWRVSIAQTGMASRRTQGWTDRRSWSHPIKPVLDGDRFMKIIQRFRAAKKWFPLWNVRQRASGMFRGRARPYLCTQSLANVCAHGKRQVRFSSGIGDPSSGCSQMHTLAL